MIFFVDDNIEMLDVYKSFAYIFLEDIDCFYFSDSHESLAKISSNFPKVIITDYKMPGLSGAELAHAAKKINPDIKIILVSENSYMIEPHFEASPFDVLCAKVFDHELLFGKIKELLKS